MRGCDAVPGPAPPQASPSWCPSSARRAPGARRWRCTRRLEIWGGGGLEGRGAQEAGTLQPSLCPLIVAATDGLPGASIRAGSPPTPLSPTPPSAPATREVAGKRCGPANQSRPLPLAAPICPAFSAQSRLAPRPQSHSHPTPHQALEIFEGMAGAGLPRDAITYSATISALAKGKQWHAALQVFEHMQVTVCRRRPALPAAH